MATEVAGKEVRHPSLVFDVSTIMNGDTIRPTGIHRVVLETALAMIVLTNGALELTRYDRLTGRYCEVESEALQTRIAAMLAVETSSASTLRRIRGRPRRASVAARRALAVIARMTPSTATHLGASLGHLRRSARAMQSAIQSIRPDVQRRWVSHEDRCHSTMWTASTTYCSLGLDFAYNDMDYLSARKQAKGFRVAMAVYDLIPCVAPQFSTQDLTSYFAKLIRVSDLVLAISQQTQTDLTAFAERLRIPLPTVEVIPLSSSLITLSPSRPSLLPTNTEEVGFAVFVSTITARKNHHLLLDVWLRLLREEPPESVPFLVIAGKPGSLSDETMRRICQDSTLRQRVIHLEGLADSEIAWLYSKCTFTLYPSLYEGWGLPVTESLDFGKVCIASNTTSLPEAGEGLAIHLDPTNREQWAARILELWSNLSLRSELEGRIRHQHQRVDAFHTTTRLLQAIGLEPDPAP